MERPLPRLAMLLGFPLISWIFVLNFRRFFLVEFYLNFLKNKSMLGIFLQSLVLGCGIGRGMADYDG